MRLSTSLAFAASATLAAAAWDCKLDNYDLTPLAGVKTVTHDVDTPPSTTRRIVRINLCDQLGKEDKVADEDQACMQVVSVKKGADDRYLQAVPLWDKDSPSPEVGDVREKEWQLRLKSSKKYAGLEQYMNINMICDPDAGNDAAPIFGYFGEGDGKATLELAWRSKAACKRDESAPDAPSDGDDGDGEKSSGGGFFHTLGVIFWIVVFALLAYFVLGALYNYQNYGARGADLIPHRDFWREVPALAQDLGSHLFNNVRQSGSRGGYSSLG
ncbi:hypothetical protein A1Q1_02758 [Trichosporon asahii var. asahii CBS 2479]|uniref:Autophagy-related protein 27 n=1 Tax=Trichosporon asahii var. asahii (strain ATCC 90039 / CBS 2479 / JCM 2466 / KCTC 7840 / NBRC 103889/ NCYC 2677 / UAMH 7654) TaxID=1186058 RepID=J5RHQ3_TRIAS|nr:hypothetical protein A1Q1_02758 [Trichosporon asahii var. asahii CBS 2479]EJT52708.1 hypothetical protein A1Q1_02758 [Trichosporon asahii var. asahii CBS 2479]